jgi:sugar lactone lactonase YvrE
VSANGIRFGPDGELYVVEAYGGELSAVDVDLPRVRNVVRTDEGLIGPDDLAFGTGGRIYITEVMGGRVMMRTPDRRVAVVDGDMPAANGIAASGNRLFANEFRAGGRLFELFPDGGARRLIADQLDWPNGMDVGPDGHLYFPAVLAGEIWRVAIDGGDPPERLIAGLTVPAAVKVGPDGRIYTVQSAGEVLAVDLHSRTVTQLGMVGLGMDNLAFDARGRLFVSRLVDGSITEVTAGGDLREVVPGGLLGPLGLDIGPGGGLVIADAWSYVACDPHGRFHRPAAMMMAGYPGVMRSVALPDENRLICATTAGDLCTYVPGEEAVVLASGLEDVVGIAVAHDRTILAAEAGAGRVRAVAPDGRTRTIASTGLDRPVAVAAAADGSCIVSDAGAGRILRVASGDVQPLLEGLRNPHGLALSGSDVFVAERDGRALHRLSLETGRSHVVASDLPFGAAAGIVLPVPPGVPPLAPGPFLPFTDVAVAADGVVYAGADGEGSVLRFERCRP